MTTVPHSTNRSLIRIFCLSLSGLLLIYAAVAAYSLASPESINLTEPAGGLLRIALGLLAVGVLFTLSLNKIASLPIDLPVAAPPGPPNPNDVTVYLNISDQGTCYWKQGASGSAELISASEIGPRLADYNFFTTRSLEIIPRASWSASVQTSV